jgi:integrase
VAVYDRWHTRKPRLVEGERVPPCKEHSRKENPLYPSAEHGKGDRWQVRWRDEDDKQCKLNRPKKGGGKGESDPDIYAEALDARIKHELNSGRYVDPTAGKIKVKEYGERWRKDLLHRDSTAERIERAFRLHIDPILGHLPLTSVRPSHIRSWVKDRSQALAPSTLTVVHSDLSSLFESAVLDRLIGSSPCAGVRLPQIEKHPHYIPTPDQVHTAAAALGKRHRAMVYIAAGCGLRGAEITGLEIDSIDFLRREIDVSQQLVCVGGQKPYLGPPKTKTSARTVELPKVTAAALAEHIKQFPPIEVEIEDRTNPRKPVRRVARLVFTSNALNPLHRAVWAHLWAPARDAAGIPKGVGLHCMRHYFATLLIHKGASVKTVQLALGHSSPTITLNEYVGEWPEAHEKTRTIVDGALGAVPRKCPAKIAK